MALSPCVFIDGLGINVSFICLLLFQRGSEAIAADKQTAGLIIDPQYNPDSGAECDNFRES